VEREVELRRKIVRAFQYLESLGVNFGYSGNISVRIGSDRILISPSGRRKSDLVPEDLLVVDLSGRVIEGSGRPSVELPTHIAIYKARMDVNAIVHVHPVYASVFAVLREGIPPVLEETVIYVGGEVQVADYAPTGSPQLGENIVKALGDRSAVILANHGILTVGRTLDEAVDTAVYVERAAKVYLLARLAGKPHPLPDEAYRLEREIYLTRVKSNVV